MECDVNGRLVTEEIIKHFVTGKENAYTHPEVREQE